MARSNAREAAMQVLYARMLGGDTDRTTLQDMIAFAPDADDLDYMQHIIDGAWTAAETLDERIGAFARNWPVARMAKVDLAILRIAAYELLQREDIPTAVAINEAVELSRRFSSDESGAFINGILGNMARAAGAENEAKDEAKDEAKNGAADETRIGANA